MAIPSFSHAMRYVRFYIQQRRMNEAASQFIIGVKDLSREQVDNVDPLAFEELFLLDKCLKGLNRGDFWEVVDVLTEKELLSYPELMKAYVDLIRINPPVGDFFRIKQIEELSSSEEYVYQYLIARYLAEQGDVTEDKEKFQEALDILEMLAPIMDRGNAHKGTERFMFVRANTFISYLRCLPVEEVKMCLDVALKERWLERSTIFDFILTLEQSLSFSLQVKDSLKEKIELAEKEIKKVAEKWQTMNMEVLSIFVGIVGLFGWSGMLALGAATFAERIKILFIASLIILMMITMFVGLLREKFLFLSIGFLMAAALGYLCFSI